jgi:hypothetical protein
MSKSLTFASILVDNDLEIFFLDFEFVEGGLLKFEMLSLILEVKFLVLDSLIHSWTKKPGHLKKI